jgi:HK97 family phage major capsid protein
VEQVSQIKLLLDELAAVVAEMEAMTEVEAVEGDAPAEAMGEEEESSLRSLADRADKLKERIAFHEKVAAKEIEMRSILERGAPAARVKETTEESTVAEKRTVFAVPKSHGALRAFRSAESAYRAGMHVKGYTFGDAEARRWCQDHGVESRAQAGGINALGGVLTSDEMSTEIIRLVEEFGAFPANARRVNMNSDTMLMARRKGGLSARAIGENSAPTTSDVTFDNIQLVAKLWGIDNRVPNSLLEDSVIDLADAMAVESAQAFAEAIDNAGFIGTGANDPYHGTVGAAVAIIDGTHTKSVVNADTSNTTFGGTTGLDLSDFTNTVARLPLYARRQAKWYISPAGYGSSMLRLMMVAGGNNVADVAGGAGLQFLGFPVVLCHPLESDLTGTASKVACLFGDLAQAATFGERRAVSIRTSTERFIELDQTLTFATTRNAIVVHDLGDNVKAGPLVALRFAS